MRTIHPDKARKGSELTRKTRVGHASVLTGVLAIIGILIARMRRTRKSGTSAKLRAKKRDLRKGIKTGSHKAAEATRAATNKVEQALSGKPADKRPVV